jgi:hypothetical protein
LTGVRNTVSWPFIVVGQSRIEMLYSLGMN